MYRIWFKTYKDDEYCGAGVSVKSYVYKRNAERAASKMYGASGKINKDGFRRDWFVSETCPFQIGE